MNINYIHTEDIHNTNAAKAVLPFIFNLFKPSSVIDVGCGTGSWLKVAKQCGATKILGLDGVQVVDSMLCIEKQEFLKHDLTQEIKFPQEYDLTICLEVVEHLPENAADTIVKTLAQSGKVVLFSAAIPGQGGQEHLNEQIPGYWQEKFKKHGFFPIDILRGQFWDNNKIDWWYRQNMLLYTTAANADKLNLPMSLHLPLNIHPELLKLKLQMLDQSESANRYLEELVDREINHPKFFPAFKRLVKSLIR
jgi:SAM-dependent methyltransferase